jgi:hypothetical protein
VVVLGVAILGCSIEAWRGTPVPFGWFEPDASMSRDDLQRLARREVVVKALPSKNSQLGVFAATELRQTPDVFVAWIRNMPQLQRSKAVAAIGRFSEPPVLKDLDGLTLDKRDIQSIRECGPGQCALKLSVTEIEALRKVAHGGSDDAIQQAFRQVLFDRLLAYRAGGPAAVAVAASRPVRPPDVFAALHASSPYIRRADARLALWLNAPHQAPSAEVESFYYWAKEYYASGKPVIVLTQVGVTRAAPGGAAAEVAVVGRQLFATRYMNGMLSHITLAREPGSEAFYMTYSTRAQLDVLSGFWGGIVRTVINGRLRGDAASVLETLRTRIESGPPKGSGG